MNTNLFHHLNSISRATHSVALAGLTLVSAATAADWSQYRGANSDGTTTEKLATKWPASGPKAMWKLPLQTGFSSFTVAGGKAYTLVQAPLEGVNREFCVAVDVNTGKIAWQMPLGVALYKPGGGDSGTPDNKGGDGPRSTPTVDGNRVYVMTANLFLVCLDAATGKGIWTHDLMKDNAGRNITWMNAASPLVDGDLVFVAGGGAGQALLGINKLDGKVVWKGQDDMMTHSTPVAATIHGTRQVIFFTQSGLVAVAPKDGNVLWRYKFKFSTSTAISPIVSNDTVYCAAGYNVGAAACKITKAGDTFTATELWMSPGNQPVANHWSTPVCKDGYLYGMFSFKEYGNGPIKCVELATGKVMWTQPGFGAGNVILAGGQLLALSDDGQLVLIDPAPTGYKEVARAKVLTGKCWSTPVLSNGRVYARSTKEGVCVDVSAKATQR